MLARLGHGGMGNVYLAVHVGPAGVNKLLVIKQLRTDIAGMYEARSMFLDEARLSMRLNHPNIVQTIEVVDDGEDLYLVMEFLDGQSLGRILDAKHSAVFPLRTKLRVLADVLEGLHYAHELADYDGTPLHVVHRDVSPHNVFVTYDGHVKLVDFGIAKAADATTVTQSGVFKGKVRYAAPEQALCGEVDRRADLFAVGTMLWEILAGRRMWEGRADAAVLASLATGNIPSVRNVNPQVPAILDTICTKALAPDPAGRFQTALDFRNALLEFEPSMPNERTLGGLVSATFARDRTQLHGVIDTQSKALREVHEGRHTVRDIPLILAAASGQLPSSADPSLVVTTGVGMVRRRARLRGRTAWLAGGALVAAAAVVVAVALSKDRSAAPPAAQAVSAPSVHLSFRATPANARFVLDGTVLASNPYDADVARDDVAHHLSIQADGFERRELDERFTRDVSVDVTLGPVAAAASVPVQAPSASALRTVVAPAPVRVPPAGPRHGSQRGIDEEDPYKQ